MLTKKSIVTEYKDYAIVTTEGAQRNIFFRSPMQKIELDAYYPERDDISAWVYLDEINSSKIRRIYEQIIGNKNVVNNINEWSERLSWGGCTINRLVPPIYFHRFFRKLTATCLNKDKNIQAIESYGYESEWNICSGACAIEKTTITLKNGKKIHLINKDYYKFTYEHVVKEFIDKGTIN